MVSIQSGMHGTPQQVQDDLASLFSRNMSFSPEFHALTPKDVPRQEPPATVPSPPPANQRIVYSVSQHYNHSAHIARPACQQAENTNTAQPQVQRPSSEPPQTEHVSTEAMLRTYGLEPALLTPSQLQLIRIADDPQKLRLLELWSICPPNKAEDIPALAWSSTSLDQEEQMARMRYERLQNPTMSLDGTSVQTGDSRWIQHSVASESEPYMVSGYDELMRREYERQSIDNQTRNMCSHFGSAIGGNDYSRATDPVYKGPEYNAQQQQLDMAAQYGAFEQSRGSYMDDDAMDM
ncbi:hypothetical protein QQS21_004989 [Conoideocrella luteorostrata]|uniref:Uncharacterized protein n=1 Tax=Conoideocrella luteorostrata TaxID=1105319 RepID=A0AAJ0FZG3_9HYPO|nr:hypothetical protein QQS21_004989 [Conoideocrella luteorostrata]